jgi:hypothetical protein
MERYFLQDVAMQRVRINTCLRYMALLATALLQGCASYDNLVSADAVPSETQAYIAGDFVTESATLTTAFVLTNLATRAEYILPFSTVKGVKAGATQTNVINVPPGEYRLTDWIVYNSFWGPGIWGREFRKPVQDPEFEASFAVPAGQVLFLGKFSTNNTWSYGYSSSVTRGRVKALPITASEANSLWSQGFPNFFLLKVACLICRN